MSVFDNNIKNYPYKEFEELFEKYDYDRFSTDPLYCIHSIYEIVSGGHKPEDFPFDDIFMQRHTDYIDIAWKKFLRIKKLFNYPTDYEIRMFVYAKTVELTDEEMVKYNIQQRVRIMQYIGFGYVHV